MTDELDAIAIGRTRYVEGNCSLGEFEEIVERILRGDTPDDIQREALLDSVLSDPQVMYV